jgi:hypothetical protein
MVAAAFDLEARRIGLRRQCRKRQKAGGKQDCKCLHRLILRKALACPFLRPRAWTSPSLWGKALLKQGQQTGSS